LHTLPVGGRGYPDHELHVFRPWRIGVLSLHFILHKRQLFFYFHSTFIPGVFYYSSVQF